MTAERVRRAWACVRRRLRAAGSENGQILLLSLVYGLVTLSLVLVVASVSSVYLERKRLLALADALSADAADAVDLGVFYTEDRGSVLNLPLTDASVQASVADYLDAAPASVVGEFEDFAVIEPTGTPDGDTAEVTLTARVRPPVLPWMLMPWADGFEIAVTSRGEAS